MYNRLKSTKGKRYLEILISLLKSYKINQEERHKTKIFISSDKNFDFTKNNILNNNNSK